jgi:hypothetical protein
MQVDLLQLNMLPNDNPQSWLRVREDIEQYPEDATWSAWKQIARQLMTDLTASGVTPFFRAGQGMHHIVFSTAENHGLTSEPRVTIEIDAAARRVRVAYSRSNLYFEKPIDENTVAIDESVTHVLRYLRRLWIETRADERLPDALNHS